jgi:ArsR family transcriptional regulator
VNDYKRSATVLRILGHPVRLQILDILRQGETCVCHIERALGRRQAYVSQQLMTLRDSGLVDSRQDGLQVYYKLSDSLVAQLLATLFGQVNVFGHAVLEDCKCPACSVVQIAAIK